MTRSRTRLPTTSALEWCLAAFSTVLLAGLIGSLVHEAFTQPSGPPVLALEAGRPRNVGGGFVLQFTARNEGLATAANVQVIGELRDETGRTVEEAEADLDYVPEGSTRRGWFHFTRDPGKHRLVLRPGGQVEP